MKIYELTEQLEAIEDELMENGGELTPEIEQRLADLDATGLMRWRINLTADIAGADYEIKRLQMVQSQKRSMLRFCDDSVKRLSALIGVPKLQTHLGWIRVQNNPPSVKLLCEVEELPAEFIRVIPEQRQMDARKILDHIKATGEIPEGVEVTRGTHVRHQVLR